MLPLFGDTYPYVWRWKKTHHEIPVFEQERSSPDNNQAYDSPCNDRSYNYRLNQTWVKKGIVSLSSPSIWHPKSYRTLPGKGIILRLSHIAQERYPSPISSERPITPRFYGSTAELRNFGDSLKRCRINVLSRRGVESLKTGLINGVLGLVYSSLVGLILGPMVPKESFQADMRSVLIIAGVTFGLLTGFFQSIALETAKEVEFFLTQVVEFWSRHTASEDDRYSLVLHKISIWKKHFSFLKHQDKTTIQEFILDSLLFIESRKISSTECTNNMQLLGLVSRPEQQYLQI